METKPVLYSHLVGKSRNEIIAISRTEIAKVFSAVDLSDYRDVRVWKTSKYFRIRFDSNVTIQEQEKLGNEGSNVLGAPSVGSSITLTVSESVSEVRPRDPKYLFILSDEIRAIAKTFNVRDSLSFRDRGESLEVRASHPSTGSMSGGSEVYLINKLTKKRDMIQHSHPHDFGRMGQITGPGGRPYVDPDPEIEMPDPAFPAPPKDRSEIE